MRKLFISRNRADEAGRKMVSCGIADRYSVTLRRERTGPYVDIGFVVTLFKGGRFYGFIY